MCLYFMVLGGSEKIKNIWNKFKHLKIYIVCVGKDYTHIDCIEKEKK